MGSAFSGSTGSAAEATGLLAAKQGSAGSAATQAQHGAEEVTRRVSSAAVAFLTFSCVAGGPFGIEVAVNAAGAFYTILALFVAALLWGMPQALMTAELGAAIPANGGPVVWVRRALGPNFAFVNGLLLVFNQVTDVVLYPTLIASYIQELDPDRITDSTAYAIKVGCTALAVLMNIVGIEALSNASAMLAVGIMLPFALIPIVAAGKGLPFYWSSTGPSGSPPAEYTKENLAVFVSTILWCMQGWSEIGMLAGEIDDAGVVLPRGMGMAAILIMLAYSCPVLFGVALSPDLENWEDGYLVTLGRNIAPWLGGFMIAGAALANMSTFLTSMAAYSRTLQAVVKENVIPIPWLGRNMTRHKTPVPAIVFLGLTTCALSYNLDFEQLVVADSVFYLLANICIAIAFIRLRYTEPDLDRPFTFPGGLPGVWLASASIVALGIFTLYADSEGAEVQLYAALGSVVAMFLLSILWKLRCAPKTYDDIDAAEIEDADLAKPVPGSPDKIELTRYSSKGHILTHRTISRAGSIARNLSKGQSLVMQHRAASRGTSISREPGAKLGSELSASQGGYQRNSVLAGYQPRLPGVDSERRMLNDSSAEDDEEAAGSRLAPETSAIPAELIRRALAGQAK